MDPLDVKIMRIRAGISLKELGEKLGLNPTTLSAYERGWRKFPPGVLQRILDFLNDHNPEAKKS